MFLTLSFIINIGAFVIYCITQPEAFRKRTSDLSGIKTAGSGGGFIISATNMHPAVKVQNLSWMAEATREFGHYPLDF